MRQPEDSEENEMACEVFSSPFLETCQITNPLPAEWPLNGSNCTATRESLEEEDMSEKSVTIKRMPGCLIVGINTGIERTLRLL